MKIKEVISDIQKLRPGLDMPLSWYIGRLGRLDKSIHSEVISTHEGGRSYTFHTGAEDSLLVPEPFTELYRFYILAQLDLERGDISRYTNNMLLYNNLLAEYKAWYNRSYMPKQENELRWW